MNVKKVSFSVFIILWIAGAGTVYAEETVSLTFSEQEPAPGSSTEVNNPLIKIKFQEALIASIKKENLLIEVDRSDVSSLAQFSEGLLSYQPQVPLSAGSHEVRITGATVNGKKIQEITWSFTVIQPDQPRTWQFGIEPTGTFEYKVREETLTPVDRSRFNSNIAVSSQTTAPFQASLNSNFQAQGPRSGPAPPAGPSQFDLANFQLALTGPTTSFSIGDVNVNFDPLSVASLSRRGIFFEQKLPFYSSGFSF